MGSGGGLPAFIVIGALKCGTTWLDQQLRHHRDLHLPSRIKEVDFFSHEYERGLDWYRSFWDEVPGDRLPGALRGEVSPTYFAHPEAPERIWRELPEVRLVAVLRDPVRRLYSQYTHWVRGTGYAGDFDRFVVEHPNAVETGFYDVHLQRYLDRFSREQLEIVVFEEMISRPAEALRSLRPRLGVPAEGPWCVADTGVVNRSFKPRFPRLRLAARRAARAVRSVDAGWAVDAAGRLGVRSLLDRGAAFPSMTQAARAHFQRLYAPHVTELESLLGRRVEAWRGGS